MSNAVLKKIINIILISIMCFSVNGECSEVEAKQPNNKFAKNIIVEIIGIDNTVIEFIEFIFN